MGPRDIIESVSSVGSFLDGGPSHPLQKAALEIVTPDVADAEAKAIRAVFGPKRDMMLRRLMGMGVHIDAAPQGAFYIWGSVHNLPEPISDGMRFFQAALERKVITVPGVFFDVNPGKRRARRASRFNSYIRFSFGPDLEQLERGLDRLEQMVAEHTAAA